MSFISPFYHRVHVTELNSFYNPPVSFADSPLFKGAKTTSPRHWYWDNRKQENKIQLKDKDYTYTGYNIRLKGKAKELRKKLINHGK